MTRGKGGWKWQENQERALKMLKEEATGDFLSYFDIKWKTQLVVDANSIGLDAILM